LQILQANAVDYTRFFRRLCDFKTMMDERNDSLRDMFIDPTSFDVWARVIAPDCRAMGALMRNEASE
jgi:uncharacterized protein YdiU (UPF0061 family)